MTAWIDEHLEALSAEPVCGYRRGTASTEPTALAAVALSAYGRHAPAEVALTWLAKLQSPDGSVGVSSELPGPCWPTGIAVLAWTSCHSRTSATSYKQNSQAAIDWILRTSGDTMPRQTSEDYDSTLIGWPWVEGTHSWLEPTAWQVIGLKAAGHVEHPRTREAVRLLVDRLLPGGGCNYGNTVVLGQTLLPHVQPTGLVLAALAGESPTDPRLGKSRDYLLKELCSETTTASLCYGLLGLAALGREPNAAGEWLAAAAARSWKKPLGLHSALLLLAAMGRDCPLVWRLAPRGATSRSDVPHYRN